MSVDQTDRVDAIGVDNASGNVVLTITDHLDWGSSDEDHLLLLQEKINTYLSFVESGELVEVYPDAAGRNVAIDVVGKYALSGRADVFFKQASSIVSGAGMTLNFSVFKPQ